ncbi:MAG TPA: replication initiation factor domain-containing protein [Rhodocyclaceae bacterium]|nr:replication initiation factor domain-containing protein [Rhodocyclaceae bacterium]
MRLRKHKHPGMPPAQVEALGLVLPEELAGLTGAAPAREDGRGAGCTPPLLIGGESPTAAGSEMPVAAMIPAFLDLSEVETTESIVLDRNQNPVIRPGVRLIKGQKVGVDWVSCVFEQTNAWRYYLNSDHLIVMENYEPVQPKEVAAFIKDIFTWVLGLDETTRTKWREFANGLNGYTYAVAMPFQSGVVHAGHSSKTVLVTISGQGAFAAKTGWEERLYWFLMGVSGWLTRIDWAYDDYDGQLFGVQKMRKAAKKGAFQRQGRPPKVELRGAWEQGDPDNTGLTLYVGSRLSGKFARVYEKGKQLGDPNSPWVRFEIEMHNSSYQLTLEMLIAPTKWFAGAYPCCEWIEKGIDRNQMEYKARCAVATVDSSINWIRHQAGGHLAGLREMYGDTELLDLLVRPDAIPLGLLTVEKVGNQFLAPSNSLVDEPGLAEA